MKDCGRNEGCTVHPVCIVWPPSRNMFGVQINSFNENPRRVGFEQHLQIRSFQNVCTQERHHSFQPDM